MISSSTKTFRSYLAAQRQGVLLKPKDELKFAVEAERHFDKKVPVAPVVDRFVPLCLKGGGTVPSDQKCVPTRFV